MLVLSQNNLFVFPNMDGLYKTNRKRILKVKSCRFDSLKADCECPKPKYSFGHLLSSQLHKCEPQSGSSYLMTAYVDIAKGKLHLCINSITAIHE